MVELLRHRQTKGAATDMFYLTPPRHISTLPHYGLKSDIARGPKSAKSGHREPFHLMILLALATNVGVAVLIVTPDKATASPMNPH